MDYSRMIHDYLDGELDQMQQDILFAELATNQDLRTDFNQQVKLQVVAQSDMALITPPLEATNAIFASLGFSIPSEEYLKNLVGDAVATSPISTLKKFWVKYFAMNVILLLMLISTGTVLIFNTNFFGIKGNGKKYNSGKQQSVITYSNKLSGMSSTSIPVISSFAENKSEVNPAANNGNAVNINRRSNSNIQRVSRNNVFANNQIDNSANSNINSYGTESGNDRNFSVNRLFADNELVSNASQDESMRELASRRVNSTLTTNSNVFVNPTQTKSDIFNPNGLTGYIINPFAPVTIDNTKWTIQIRRLQLNPAENVDLSQSFDKKDEKTWNSNLSFAALYKLNPYLSFGVEVGWEAFTQVYLYTNDKRQTNKYYQNPQLFWYGGTIKYSMPEFLWEDVIYPYAQLTLGGTTVGPILRPQVGIIINPTNILRLNAGFEAAGLIYRVPGLTYGSGKYGFTFGGSVNF